MTMRILLPRAAEMDVKELASARAAQARDIGIDGLVCSAEEVTALRDIAGAGMVS
jgi:orotidine-5'-phosphate decarboxylase